MMHLTVEQEEIVSDPIARRQILHGPKLSPPGLAQSTEVMGFFPGRHACCSASENLPQYARCKTLRHSGEVAVVAQSID